MQLAHPLCTPPAIHDCVHSFLALTGFRDKKYEDEDVVKKSLFREVYVYRAITG
jgi:hypothetical protein